MRLRGNKKKKGMVKATNSLGPLKKRCRILPAGGLGGVPQIK
jgi:hypothetical protein